ALLQSGSRGSSAHTERFGLRRILVVSQVALSIVLLMGALLFARSLRNLTTLDTGFKQTGILVTSVDFERLELPEERHIEYRRYVATRVQPSPGFDSAGGGLRVPFGGETWTDAIIPEGSSEEKDFPWENSVGPGSFKTLGTPSLPGRDFDDRDTAT